MSARIGLQTIETKLLSRKKTVPEYTLAHTHRRVSDFVRIQTRLTSRIA
jgi:hypothetical protein